MFSLLKPAPKTETAPATAGERPAARRTVAPRVDIRETDEAVLVIADMPGVAADSVDVEIYQHWLEPTE